MTSLFEALQDRPGEERLLFARGAWTCVTELLAAASRVRAVHAELKDEPVMFAMRDGRDSVTGILALDGFASDLLLVGPDTNENQSSQFASRAGINYCLSADGTLAENNARDLDPELASVSRSTRWLIPTSGTTGTPKLVEHTLGSLSATVRSDQSRGRGIVWGMVYDLSRFAGIQVLLQAVLGGSAVAIPSNSADMDATRKEFREAGVNALSATPSMWRKLLMAGIADDLKLSIITLGGETADELILRELRKRFPEARITHIYASTEAGVGFSVTDGRAGFPVDFLDREFTGQAQLRVDVDGRLWIRKAMPARYVGGDMVLVDDSGWLDTGDLVERREDRFHFLGRANGSINVGGRKVQPSEVENVILQVPGVAMAAVVGRPNPIMGSIVEAWIVPDKEIDNNELSKSILKECNLRLETYKVPASLKMVDEIPLTVAGKIRRI